MTERRGKVLSYNPTNRLGEIQPEGTTLRARFYLPAVTNPDPLPKAGDVVTFEAPEPRKNKQGKSVQGDATSVTVVEYAPAPPPRAATQARHPRDTRGRPRDSRGRFPRREGGVRRDRSSSAREGTRSRTRTADGKPAQEARPPRREGGARKPRQARTAPRTQGRRGAFSRARLLVPGAVSAEVLDSRSCHPGLLIERMIAWPSQGLQLSEAQRRYFLERAVIPTQHAVAERTMPFAAVRRRQEELLSLIEESGEGVWSSRLRLSTRLALSLNARTILGNVGGSWRYTDAIPIIPGTLLKGTLKAFLHGEGAFDEVSPVAKDALMRLRSVLCASGRGRVTFYDAIAISRSALLQTDGLLCTQPGWYSQGFDPHPGQRGRSSFFLTVKPGAEFLFSISVAGPKEESRTIAQECGWLLQQLALHAGLGALTESGYGRFYIPTPRTEGAADLAPAVESVPA